MASRPSSHIDRRNSPSTDAAGTATPATQRDIGARVKAPYTGSPSSDVSRYTSRRVLAMRWTKPGVPGRPTHRSGSRVRATMTLLGVERAAHPFVGNVCSCRNRSSSRSGLIRP